MLTALSGFATMLQVTKSSEFMRKFTFNDIVFSLLNKYGALPNGWEVTSEAETTRQMVARERQRKEQAEQLERQRQQQAALLEQKRQEQAARRNSQMQMLLGMETHANSNSRPSPAPTHEVTDFNARWGGGGEGVAAGECHWQS